jgi:Enolase C-terminal domain-like
MISLVSLGIRENPKVLVNKVEEELRSGCQRIRLKIKAGKEHEYVAAVRKEFPNIRLFVDANSAYILDDVANLRKLVEFRLLMIGQPLSWDDIHAHSKLQKEIETANASRAPATPSPPSNSRPVKLARVSGHTIHLFVAQEHEVLQSFGKSARHR